MRVCGSGDVRRRRLPCRLGKAVYWRNALRLGHATTFAAARWRRAHCGPRRGTSSCRYRCRSRRSRYWVSETWRAPCLWCPLPASLAGRAGARPGHPTSGLTTLEEWNGESYSARNCASRFDSRVTSMISDDCTSPAWLAGGGEMGGRMRAKDWSASPLGHPETWPQSVKTAVSICLNSRVPIALWLGPELRLIYNDAYIPFLGETKHPAMLGAPGREAWGEIW